MGASVTVIASDAQVEYRLAGHSGCGDDHQLDYRLTTPERPMRWIGAGAEHLGLQVGETLTDAALDKARALMNGVHPITGEQLVEPKTAIAPAGKLPAAPLVDAVLKSAAERGIAPAMVWTSQRQRAEWGRLERGVQRLGEGYRISVKRAAAILDAAGLDPDVVYGQDVFDDAAAHAEDKIVIGNRGYDLTVTLPKSFSILWAFADDETTTQLENVLDQAALDTLALAEQTAGYALKGHHGDGQSAQRVDGQGLTGWMTVHRTARPTVDGQAGDPHLHAHLSVANLVRTGDGDWATIGAGGRDLFNHVQVYGEYVTARARALTEDLGFRWQPDPTTGQWEIAGVSRELIDLFSKRGMDITALLDELGIDDPSLAQRRTAAALTREAKGDTASRPDTTLRQQWSDEARAAGLPVDGLIDHARDRATELPDARVQVEDLQYRLLVGDGAPPELTATAQRFTRRDVMAAVAAEPAAGLTGLDELIAITDRVLAHDGAVRLPDSTGTAHLSNHDRYTTADLIQAEVEILERSAAALGAGQAVVPEAVAADVQATVERRSGFRLSEEQAAVYRRLITAGHGVEAVIGVAGSGKTTLMATAREAWERAGYRVAGVTTAAVAAENLRLEAGITAGTIAGLLLDGAAAERLADIDVLVVDEAGMVGTREYLAILDAAQQAGTKVVNIGDPKQLAAPSPGGFLAAQHQLVGGLTLTENRRQRHHLDQRAVALWRDDDFAEALAVWKAAGDVRATPDRDTALAAAVRGWRVHNGDYADRYERLTANLLLASTRHDVAALNQVARAIARQAGDLTGRDVELRLAGGGHVAFAVGDVVMTRRNDYSPDDRPDVLNGRRGYVESIDPAARTVTMSWGDGQSATIDADYIAAGGLDHGYAMTVHKAQGQTADHVHGIADDLGARAGYTLLTRHRETVALYLPADRMLNPSEYPPERIEQLSPPELLDLTTAALTARAEADAGGYLVVDELLDDHGRVSSPEPLAKDVADAVGRRQALLDRLASTRPHRRAGMPSSSDDDTYGAEDARDTAGRHRASDSPTSSPLAEPLADLETVPPDSADLDLDQPTDFDAHDATPAGQLGPSTERDPVVGHDLPPENGQESLNQLAVEEHAPGLPWAISPAEAEPFHIDVGFDDLPYADLPPHERVERLTADLAAVRAARDKARDLVARHAGPHTVATWPAIRAMRKRADQLAPYVADRDWARNEWRLAQAAADEARGQAAELASNPNPDDVEDSARQWAEQHAQFLAEEAEAARWTYYQTEGTLAAVAGDAGVITGPDVDQAAWLAHSLDDETVAQLHEAAITLRAQSFTAAQTANHGADAPEESAATRSAQTAAIGRLRSVRDGLSNSKSERRPKVAQGYVDKSDEGSFGFEGAPGQSIDSPEAAANQPPPSDYPGHAARRAIRDR
jgi:conjugative relaxase-like TrwC/TraI family protein